MTYRDDRAALAQHLADLEARLAGIRGARASLSTLEHEEKAVVAELDALRKRVAPRADEIRRSLPLLERIEIASPCSVPWDSMAGDDRKRFCGQCKLHVYNIAAMTRAQAESLLSCEGAVCVRLFRREDGTVLTSDCPVGLRRKRRRRLGAVLVVSAAVSTAVLGALSAFHRDVNRVAHVESIDPPITPIQGGAAEVSVPLQGRPLDPVEPAATQPRTPHGGRVNMGRRTRSPHQGMIEAVGQSG